MRRENTPRPEAVVVPPVPVPGPVEPGLDGGLAGGVVVVPVEPPVPRLSLVAPLNIHRCCGDEVLQATALMMVKAPAALRQVLLPDLMT